MKENGKCAEGGCKRGRKCELKQMGISEADGGSESTAKSFV